MATQIAASAAGSAVSQAALNSMMSEGIATSVMPAATAQIQNMTPTLLAEAAKDPLLNDLVMSKMMGTEGMKNIAGSVVKGTPNSLSFIDKLKGFGGDAMDIFGNENFTNAIDGGTKLFNAWDTHNARNDARDFQDSTLAMSQAAHNRNMAADDRRQNLNF